MFKLNSSIFFVFEIINNEKKNKQYESPKPKMLSMVLKQPRRFKKVNKYPAFTALALLLDHYFLLDHPPQASTGDLSFNLMIPVAQIF